MMMGFDGKVHAAALLPSTDATPIGCICQLSFDPQWQLRVIVVVAPSTRSGLLERDLQDGQFHG